MPRGEQGRVLPGSLVEAEPQIPCEGSARGAGLRPGELLESSPAETQVQAGAHATGSMAPTRQRPHTSSPSLTALSVLLSFALAVAPCATAIHLPRQNKGKLTNWHARADCMETMPA